MELIFICSFFLGRELLLYLKRDRGGVHVVDRSRPSARPIARLARVAVGKVIDTATPSNAISSLGHWPVHTPISGEAQ